MNHYERLSQILEEADLEFEDEESEAEPVVHTITASETKFYFDAVGRLVAIENEHTAPEAAVL